MARPVTDAVIKAIQRNLTEFGYAGLTTEQVREQVDKVLAGEKPGIIGMFAKTMLQEGGYLD